MKSALQKARDAPASTKAKILAAAEEIFAARGFDGSSTREIAAKAGVNISSLHYHWESKETLYFAVFQDIYDRILTLARESIGPVLAAGGDTKTVVETTMERLIDFFLDHPNIPRLLVRRVLETADATPAIERDILSPAWAAFTGFMRDIGLPPLGKLDSQLFMLSVNSLVLLFTLDSQAYGNLLGGSIRTPALRRAVRQHIIDVTLRLLRVGEPCGRS
jgi:AcrR family transcriptional regulator